MTIISDQEAIDWIEKMIDLARACLHAKPACVQFSPVVDASAVRVVEVIGEVLKNLPKELRPMLPRLPLEKYAGMRDILAHKYWDIDMPVVWATVEHDLPVLKDAITALRQAAEDLLALEQE